MKPRGPEIDIARLRSNPTRFKNSYEAGYNCGLHGADVLNCHFRWFGSPENTKEWERGKALGERERKRIEVRRVRGGAKR